MISACFLQSMASIDFTASVLDSNEIVVTFEVINDAFDDISNQINCIPLGTEQVGTVTCDINLTNQTFDNLQSLSISIETNEDVEIHSIRNEFSDEAVLCSETGNINNEVECSCSDNTNEDCVIKFIRSQSVDLLEIFQCVSFCEETGCEVEAEDDSSEFDETILVVVLPVSLCLCIIIFLFANLFMRRKIARLQILEEIETPQNHEQQEVKMTKVILQPKKHKSKLENLEVQYKHFSSAAETVSTQNSFLFERSNVRFSKATSVMSVQTTLSYKSQVSEQDYIDHEKIKAVSKIEGKKLIELSQIFWTKQPKNLTECEYFSKVLKKIIPLVKIEKMQSYKRLKILEEFCFVELPQMSLIEYLERLMYGLNRWFHADSESFLIGSRCLVLAVLYMDQLKVNVKDFQLTMYNSHTLYATLMLVAAKFTEDSVITNIYWSSVCGLPVEDISRFEQILCFKLDFEFTLATDSLRKIKNLLSK